MGIIQPLLLRLCNLMRELIKCITAVICELMRDLCSKVSLCFYVPLVFIKICIPVVRFLFHFELRNIILRKASLDRASRKPLFELHNIILEKASLDRALRKPIFEPRNRILEKASLDRSLRKPLLKASQQETCFYQLRYAMTFLPRNTQVDYPS